MVYLFSRARFAAVVASGTFAAYFATLNMDLGFVDTLAVDASALFGTAPGSRLHRPSPPLWWLGFVRAFCRDTLTWSRAATALRRSCGCLILQFGWRSTSTSAGLLSLSLSSIALLPSGFRYFVLGLALPRHPGARCLPYRTCGTCLRAAFGWRVPGRG